MKHVDIHFKLRKILVRLIFMALKQLLYVLVWKKHAPGGWICFEKAGLFTPGVSLLPAPPRSTPWPWWPLRRGA